MASGHDTLNSLKIVHDDEFHRDEDKYYSYKIISLDAATREVSISGDFAQFGVYRGRCARRILRYLPKNSSLHLFDSFEGLPEDWIGSFKKGTFALPEEEIPVFNDKRVKIHKGWFTDSLPRFIETQDDILAFVHIDCDLYSSTLDALNGVNRLLNKGTVILFDEYIMHHKDEEHRALLDWASANGRKFEYLWRTQHVQVAIRIII